MLDWHNTKLMIYQFENVSIVQNVKLTKRHFTFQNYWLFLLSVVTIMLMFSVCGALKFGRKLFWSKSEVIC